MTLKQFNEVLNVLDVSQKIDVVFNYGLFDLDSDDF